MKLKFTLTYYISDEFARHVPKKSAKEVQQYENKSSIKMSFKREREGISKMK